MIRNTPLAHTRMHAHAHTHAQQDKTTNVKPRTSRLPRQLLPQARSVLEDQRVQAWGNQHARWGSAAQVELTHARAVDSIPLPMGAVGG